MAKKCLVLVPTFSGPPPLALANFMQIASVAGRVCAGWKFAYQAPGRQSLVRAMTSAAETVLAQDFDCLITFDDDCFPPFDCIPRLLAHREAGHVFVAGAGVMKGYPHTTTIGKEYAEGYTLVQQADGSATLQGHEWLDDLDALAPLQDVDFCGVPVAVIGREAFERAEKPWFSLHGADGGQVTHDVFFCRRLRAAGMRVLVDTTIRCGHLADPPVITFENRKLARELVG